MKTLVVYESVYGNTRAVAEAVADALGAPAIPVHEAVGRVGDADLLVVGGPTHMHGLATARSRQMAAAGALEDGHAAVDASATAEPGLRQWLRDLTAPRGGRAAAFDTRLDRSPFLTGVASRGIAKRLRHHGYEVVSSESFLVADAEGPLEEGELERARAWGAELARAIGAEARQEANA